MIISGNWLIVCSRPMGCVTWALWQLAASGLSTKANGWRYEPKCLDPSPDRPVLNKVSQLTLVIEEGNWEALPVEWLHAELALGDAVLATHPETPPEDDVPIFSGKASK